MFQVLASELPPTNTNSARAADNAL